jgi:hypothetical protein
MKSNSVGGSITSQQSVSNFNNNNNQKSSFGGPNQSTNTSNINKSTKPINQNQNNRQNNKPPRFMKQQVSGNRSGNGGSSSNPEINGSQNVTISNNNAWEKPLNTSSLRHNENELISMNSSNNVYDQADNNELNKNENHSSSSSLNKTDSNNSKQQVQPLLDGSTPPVTTIIFENTNFKTVPQPPIKRQQQNSPSSTQTMTGGQQAGLKSTDPNGDGVFSKQSAQSQNSIQNIIDAQQATPESITSALSNMTFPSSKCDSEYEKEMKMAFTFDSDLSQLTDDKTSNVSSAVSGKPGGGVGLMMPRTMHSVTSSASQIHPSTAELNMKIASVKKVWENAPVMPTVLEQQDDHSGNSHLTSNFVTSQHQTHIHQYVQHGNMVTHTLSPGPSYSASFGPDPSALEQHFGKQDGGVEQEYVQGQQHNVGQNHAHQNQNLNLVKHAAEALATNTNVCKVKPNQQQIHQSSLAGLSPPPMQQGTLQAAPQAYYPPTQFGNMSAIPSPPAVLFNSSPMPSQGGLYTQFQIEAGRSQYSQYPTHYGASNAPYNAYMQTPPNIQTGPTPEMFQNMAPPYRMPQTVQNPFNQNQQLNNPNTVLISSSSNSLMSASVKPSSQQIGAIGSKTATVGHPIGQQYMNMYAQQAPPLQNNSYYSSSAGNQGAFFGGPGAGTAQSYSLQAPAMFGGHGGPAPSNAQQQPVANFSSQFLSSPLLTTAINQQYRGAPTQQAAAAYIKSNQQQSHIQDSWELQNQVLQQQQQQQQSQQNRNTGTGLSVGRPGGPPPQQQGQQQRYIAPIQRPTNYPQPQQNMVPQNRNPRLNISQSNCGPNKHYINPNSSGVGGGGGGRDRTTIKKSLKSRWRFKYKTNTTTTNKPTAT